MTHEQTSPQIRNQDPGQGEINLSMEISLLRHNQAIGCEDLFSSRKMQSGEYPDQPGVRVALETPIETAESDRSDVKQDLMAVVALGENVALGVVRGRDSSGEELNYISLLNNGLSDNEGRAKLISVITKDAPVRISRNRVEQRVGREGVAPGVSGTHCTIELADGVLTVVDEGSLNGTSVFTNTTKHRTRAFGSIKTWSQPSLETEGLIKIVNERQRHLKASHLGRFTVGS